MKETGVGIARFFFRRIRGVSGKVASKGKLGFFTQLPCDLFTKWVQADNLGEPLRCCREGF